MIRYIAFTAALAAGLAAGAAASATEAGIEVAMNQAKIIKLTRAADTVVVGEPKIADVTVKDSTTIVLTGKGFGVTNLVILDQEGAPIVDEHGVFWGGGPEGTHDVHALILGRAQTGIQAFQ